MLRQFQQTAIDRLYAWWMKYTDINDCPILELPCGAGKSVIIAELVRLLFDTWPDEHPRTVVLVPSKELAVQNAEKLAAMLPSHLSIGYYSAAIGQKRPDSDVIVATIGSIYKQAHLLGNIKVVIIDECHLVNPDGAGRFREFLNSLTHYCRFRALGLTATPFCGNGVWLTEGKDPLFTGIAHKTGIKELLDLGYLAPLSRPVDVIKTYIDTTGIGTVSDDYNLDQLGDRVEQYLKDVAAEAATLAAGRSRWIAFTPTVLNAESLVSHLTALGIKAALVCGATPKKEREELIAEFKRGGITCLVTVLALTTGFDVPDVDCLIWCRPTQSKVLYVQGFGRGMRIAQGKTDCLVLDFSDTTARLGPIDEIKGRKKPKPADYGAPYAICDECGAQVRPASALICPECGAILREEQERVYGHASDAPILSGHKNVVINTYEVTGAKYRLHKKDGSPDSMRVDYWAGLKVVASEWICLFHEGFARQKAASWWARHMPGHHYPDSVNSAVSLCFHHALRPSEITVNESWKYPVIVSTKFNNNEAA